MSLAKSDLPVDADGRLYHVGLKVGEASNLIIVCGDELRATSISKHFDSGPTSTIRSSRGFLTINGDFNGASVTIMAIGMGYPMMDFAVRELRAIVRGPMVIVRLGSCGFVNNPCWKDGPEHVIGSIAVAGHGSCVIQRNYDYQFQTDKSCVGAYKLSDPFPANAALSEIMLEKSRQVFGQDRVLNTLNLSADSFYSSQGRQSEDNHFQDCNTNLLIEIQKKFCSTLVPLTLEMESGHLLHLAGCVNEKEPIIAAAMHIVISDRERGLFLVDLVKRDRLDRLAGLAVLQAITEYALKYLK